MKTAQPENLRYTNMEMHTIKVESGARGDRAVRATVVGYPAASATSSSKLAAIVLALCELEEKGSEATERIRAAALTPAGFRMGVTGMGGAL